MIGKYIGKRVQRNEDPRLLTGQALFVDDVDIPGMLHAAFLRSDYAHAYLKNIDVSAARARLGSHLGLSRGKPRRAVPDHDPGG